jgi:hypothetical protein
LTLQDVQAILAEARLRQDYCTTSMILVQFKSFSGGAELDYINRNSGADIAQQLHDGIHPIRINMMKSRKNNPHPWFTFIDAPEAGEALKMYFEKARGWPGKGEPIWFNEDHEIMRLQAYADRWRALQRHVKLIPKKEGHSRGDRYGKGLHNLRDLARSLVHEAHRHEHRVKGKKTLFDAKCPEFWMGHTIDRLAYNEFWKTNPTGVRDQYLIAEPYLSISRPAEAAEETKALEEKIQQLEFDIKLLQEASGLRVRNPTLGGESTK